MDKIKEGEGQKRQDAGVRRGRKVAFHCVFPMICGSGGSKSNLAKATGAEPDGQMRDEKVHAVVARSTTVSKKGKNTSRLDHFWKFRCRKSARPCGTKHISKSKRTKFVHTRFRPLLEVEMSKKCTPLWREAHFQVKMCKAHHSQTTFGSSAVEKVHAVVARSKFPSQNVQSTPFSDHFRKLRCRKVHAVAARSTFPSQKCPKMTGSEHFWKFCCRKSVRRCGPKHISKSKCRKHTIHRSLLEVEMSKKCTPLWQARFQVKMHKASDVRTTFGS